MQSTAESTSLTGKVKVFGIPKIANCPGIVGMTGGSSTGVTFTLKVTVAEVAIPSNALMLRVVMPFLLRAGFKVKVQFGAVPPTTMLGEVVGSRIGSEEFVIVSAEQGRLLSMSVRITLTIKLESSFIN